MKKMQKTGMVLLLLALAALVGLSGCGKKDDGGVKKILVGTSNDYPPLCYLDADGNLRGLEKDVLDAIDAKLPQYEFEYEVLEFKNILVSLEAGRLDIGAHNYGITDERLEKYLFSNQGYYSSDSYIVVLETTNNVTTFDDLRGRTISVPPASGWAHTVEEYNKAHASNPMLIYYYETTPDVLITNMVTGVVDATLLDESLLLLANLFWNAHLKKVGVPIGDSEPAHFVYQKNANELRDAVDGALRELNESGETERIMQKAKDDFLAAASR
jgi:L-cystine transport system substrate-binding protein